MPGGPGSRRPAPKHPQKNPAAAASSPGNILVVTSCTALIQCCVLQHDNLMVHTTNTYEHMCAQQQVAAQLPEKAFIILRKERGKKAITADVTTSPSMYDAATDQMPA